MVTYPLRQSAKCTITSGVDEEIDYQIPKAAVCILYFDDDGVAPG